MLDVGTVRRSRPAGDQARLRRSGSCWGRKLRSVLDLEEELRRVVEAFDSVSIPYALCGGLALAVHGHPRATIDIDLLVREEDVGRATDLAGVVGFTFKARPMTFSDGAVPIHRVTKVDASDGDTLMLDLLVVTPRTEHVWATRETRDWAGRTIAVVSREGLIALKRLRSSAQDLADIAALQELS